MTAPLLEARDLRMVFRADEVDTAAVRGASLVVRSGEFIVIEGASGCGKSTLLSVLGLMEAPTGGDIRYEGQDVASLSETARARLRGTMLGFVFQAFHLIPCLSVRDNIALPLRFHRDLPAADRHARVVEAAQQVGLEQRLDHRPAQLSGGQQQRVAVARALAGRPRLLLADEPTGNLDRANGDQVMDLIRAAHASGTAVILVTHEPRFHGIGDRRVTMHDGQILSDVATARTS